MTNEKEQAAILAQKEEHMERAIDAMDMMITGINIAYGGEVMVATIINAFLDLVKIARKGNGTIQLQQTLDAMSIDLANIGIDAAFHVKPCPKIKVKE